VLCVGSWCERRGCCERVTNLNLGQDTTREPDPKHLERVGTSFEKFK
jgi:hypothetical protein